jgi:hypothetical protein
MCCKNEFLEVILKYFYFILESVFRDYFKMILFLIRNIWFFFKVKVKIFLYPILEKQKIPLNLKHLNLLDFLVGIFLVVFASLLSRKNLLNPGG